MIALRGAMVVLRTLERADCRALWYEYEPDQLAPTEPLNPGLSIEGADRWFEEMQSKQGREQLYLGIFTCEGRLIGDIQLAQIDWRNRTAELGAGITRQSDRGHGYGLDATRTLLRYGFLHLGLYRVTARTAEHNEAARQVLTKCGFVPEGHEREAIYLAGRRYGRLIYGLLASEFREEDVPCL